MKTFTKSVIITLALMGFGACGSSDKSGTHQEPAMANNQAIVKNLEQSLNDFIINPWYPRIIDTIDGGYLSDLDFNWTLTKSSQAKALVQQARHIWSTSFLYETYPDRKEFLEYAEHGYKFLRDFMWDKEFGGFHAFVEKNGKPVASSINDKRIYGQAFAIYGLSMFHRISCNPEALELAKKGFLWMEKNAHDHNFGGYFEQLERDGSPTGLKDFNSSIHLMEAFTELYSVWPDSLVRERLEEMFYLIRDTFVHADGFLQLYFYPDWKLVPDGDKHQHHYTYGHDVETAYLLLETAHMLGWGEDERTHFIAKRLVDHSLESGWDQESGGFYDAGKEIKGEIRIINERKSWWSQIEGLNALILMYTLYPEDPWDYLALANRMWDYMDTSLIDKANGGWYNFALDVSPDSKTQRKSHAWKTTYHNVRGMVNCIRMLQDKH